MQHGGCSGKQEKRNISHWKIKVSENKKSPPSGCKVGCFPIKDYRFAPNEPATGSPFDVPLYTPPNSAAFGP